MIIIEEKEGKRLYSKAEEAAWKEIYALSNKSRLKIIKALRKKGKSSIDELSEETGISSHALYYHIKELRKAGLIKTAETEKRRGAVLNYLLLKETNLLVKLGGEWTEEGEEVAMYPSTSAFLLPIIEGKTANSIIIGSPDPHGEFKARSRDSYLAANLTFLLGRLMKNKNKQNNKNKILLDTEAGELKGNALIMGGPAANIVTNRINSSMPIGFTDKKPFGLISHFSGKTYADEGIGVVERIQNPFDSEGIIIFVGGISLDGTKAAVLALSEYGEDVLREFPKEKSGNKAIEWGVIVQGTDRDGDGRVDSVEIVEEKRGDAND